MQMSNDNDEAILRYWREKRAAGSATYISEEALEAEQKRRAQAELEEQRAQAKETKKAEFINFANDCSMEEYIKARQGE